MHELVIAVIHLLTFSHWIFVDLLSMLNEKRERKFYVSSTEG